MRHSSRRTYFLALAAAMLVGPVVASADFMETAGGSYVYTDSNNWDSAGINGVWPATLAVAGSQTLTFGHDTTLGTGLDLEYGPSTSGANLTFTSDGTANYTLTVDGDITFNPQYDKTSNGSATQTATIGSTSANKGLNLDLDGGTRTFYVAPNSGNSAKQLTIDNTISHGSMIATGGGTLTVAGTFSLANLTVRSINLNLNGVSSSNTTDALSEALTVDRAGIAQGVDVVTLAPNAAKNITLSAGSLAQANNGVVLFRGTNLGVNSIASQTVNSSNIEFSTAPTSALVGGGGAAGTANISIIPWAVGGTSTSDLGSGFVTYDSANGIRVLSDANNEYDDNFANVGSVAGGDATTDHNVLMTSGSSYALTEDTTINSLLLQQNSTVSGTNTLTVKSGAILALLPTNTKNLNAVISATVAFGGATAYIGTAYPTGNGQADLVFSTITGTGGVVIYNSTGLPPEGHEGGVIFTADAAYSGNTTIFGQLEINGGPNTLPNATSGYTGDVFVYGNLLLNSPVYSLQINGLNGTGLVGVPHSKGQQLIVGDGNANGTFSGTLSQFGVLSLTKIGSGMQALSGINNSYTGATTITGGVLRVYDLEDGGVVSSMGKASNAAASLVLSGGTLQYVGAGGMTDHLFTIGQTVAGTAGTLDASGSGAISFSNIGSVAYGHTAQAHSLVLTGTNTGDNNLYAAIGDNTTAAVSVTKNGVGTWALNGINTYSGATTITGGTLLIGDSAANNGATIGGSGVSVTGGTLGGYGTISSAVVVNATGHLAPGASIGTLTVSNALTLAGESDFEIDNLPTGGPTNDQVTGMTALTYGGSLVVTNVEGDDTNAADWTDGETFTLFVGGGVTADSFFSSISLPELPSGFVWETFDGAGQNDQMFDYNNGLIRVQDTNPVPEPASLALLGLGAMGLLVRRRRGGAA